MEVSGRVFSSVIPLHNLYIIKKLALKMAGIIFHLIVYVLDKILSACGYVTPADYRVGMAINQGQWADLPLVDIIHRVEESETSWPARTVVSCATVCRSWREITKKIVGG